MINLSFFNMELALSGKLLPHLQLKILKNAVSLFLISCEASCTPVTISGCRLSLELFLKWLADSQKLDAQHCRIEDVTKNMIVEYMVCLRNRGIKNTSVASYLRSIRTFFNWCFKEGHTDFQIFFRSGCRKMIRKPSFRFMPVK